MNPRRRRINRLARKARKGPSIKEMRREYKRLDAKEDARNLWLQSLSVGGP